MQINHLDKNYKKKKNNRSNSKVILNKNLIQFKKINQVIQILN